MTDAVAHICIVSERLLPNLIPVLAERPDMVLLLASDRMAREGSSRRLERILDQQGIACETSTGLPSNGYREIHDYAARWLEGVYDRHSDKELVLNVTGGNKLMTIALMKVMHDCVSRVIYTDTAHGCIETIPAVIGEEGTVAELTSVIDVPTYLAAQGMVLRRSLDESPEWVERAKGRKAVTKFLGKEAAQIGDFLGALNYLANGALDDRGEALVDGVQRFKHKPRGRWEDTLRYLVGNTGLQWDEDHTVHFPDADTARFLGGGWLEEYAWHQARDLRPTDVRVGAEGTWEGTLKGRNELDVVIAHNNRLLLVECKTLRLGADDDKDDQMLYKLDSVGDDVKGLFGEVVLLSARRPTEQVMDRATHHGITVLGPEELNSFQAKVKAWMDTGRFPADYGRLP